MTKKTTLEDLARMMKRGFDELATKAEMKEGFKGVNERLDKIEKRLFRMDATIFIDYKRRIQKLETDVEYLKDISGIK
ncbi:MAG: hypothetical protein Q8R12_04245 [bacterium]|nr:hypothetical protein [bacterium]